MLPVILTFVYGAVMSVLNAKDNYDGPYPFFRVHDQSKAATAMWMAVLTGIIAVISTVISKLT